MFTSARTVATAASKATARCYSASGKVEALKFFVGGNWKCNGSVAQVNDLISMLNQSTLSTDTEVVVCPSPVYVQGVQEKLRSDVAVGAQDCWVQGNGAFTGETSADMLTDMGVGWVVIGHSERRGKGETNEEVAKKAKYALDKGLSIMACCGEPLESREAGTTNEFVFPQIKAYADVFTKEDWKKVVVAYEPIWAIGTGLTATPEQAHTHMLISGNTSLKLPEVKSLRQPVSFTVDLPVPRLHLVFPPSLTLMDSSLEEPPSNPNLLISSTATEARRA